MELIDYTKRDPRCSIATHENLLLLYFSEAIQLADIQAFALAHRKVYARHPEGIGVFGLVEPTGVIPSAEVREAARRLADETAAEVRFHATVLFGDGFWAGAIRSLVNGIFLLSRSRYPQSVFSSVDEAVRWASAKWDAPRGWTVRTTAMLRQFREEASHGRR